MVREGRLLVSSQIAFDVRDNRRGDLLICMQKVFSAVKA